MSDKDINGVTVYIRGVGYHFSDKEELIALLYANADDIRRPHGVKQQYVNDDIVWEE